MRPEIALYQRLPGWARIFLMPFLFVVGVLVVLPVVSVVTFLRHEWFPNVCALCQQRGVRGAMFTSDHTDGVRSRWVRYCDVCGQMYRLHDDGSHSIIPSDRPKA